METVTMRACHKTYCNIKSSIKYLISGLQMTNVLVSVFYIGRTKTLYITIPINRTNIKLHHRWSSDIMVKGIFSTIAPSDNVVVCKSLREVAGLPCCAAMITACVAET